MQKCLWEALLLGGSWWHVSWLLRRPGGDTLVPHPPWPQGQPLACVPICCLLQELLVTPKAGLSWCPTAEGTWEWPVSAWPRTYVVRALPSGWPRGGRTQGSAPADHQGCPAPPWPHCHSLGLKDL